LPQTVALLVGELAERMTFVHDCTARDWHAAAVSMYRAPAAIEPPAQTRASAEYAELKRLVQARGLLRRQPGYYTTKFAVTGGLLCVAVLALIVSGNDAWIRLVEAAFLGFVVVQIGLLAHDLGHHQIVDSGRMHTVLGLILGNFLMGVSRAWWRGNHDAHHAHPNHLDMDPNVQILFICTTPDQALSRPAWVQWVIRHQVSLLVPIFCLEFFSMHHQSIDHVLRRRPGTARGEGLILAAHFVVYALVLNAILGLPGAIVFGLIHHFFTGLYMASIFAPNHKGMPLVEGGDGPVSFLRQQALTARNVRGGAVVDLLYGGLNYQIEHHLFPTMPRNNLSRAQPLVRAYCQAHGIAYYDVGFVQSWREILGHFSEVSRALASV
jgi:fatty acid desaturase